LSESVDKSVSRVANQSARRASAGDDVRAILPSHRRMVGLASLLVLALSATTALDLTWSHRKAVESIDYDLVSVVRGVTEYASATVEEIDRLLRHVVNRAAESNLDGSDPITLRGYLRELVEANTYIRGASVENAKGQIVFASQFSSLPEETLSSGDAIQEFRTRPDLPLYIGDPRPSPEDGRLLIGFSRPIKSPSGDLLGVATVIAMVEHFQRFLQAVTVEHGASAGIVRADGMPIARHPPVVNPSAQALDGLRARIGRFMRGHYPEEPGRPILEPSVFKDGDVLIRMQSIANYPLFAIVSRDVADAMTPWKRQSLSVIARTVALTLAALAVLWLLARALHRQDAARAMLRASEERFGVAVAGSKDGIWDWEIASDLLFVSARAQTLLGMTPGEELRPREQWISIIKRHPDDRAAYRHALNAHREGQSEHIDVEFRAMCGTGEWRWFRQRGIALRDERGIAFRMAGSLEDISDRKRIEHEREQLEAQLRQAQKLEAMGTLAGGIAHDFNNILGAVLGYSEMAMRSADEGTRLRRDLDSIVVAANRGKALVDRILAFSRSGMGDRMPVHVERVVTEGLDLLAASLPATVRIEQRLAAANAAVLGDPTQVHQVVMNLVTNAIQAMESGGIVRVSLDLIQVDEGKTVTTATIRPGSYLLLVVADTGGGIAPEIFDRIFDPFFTTKEVGVGTGLGLSLVHGIVAELGGGIDVTTATGQGSTFAVYLPHSGANVQSMAHRPDAPLPGRGETILVVDDEKALVELTVAMLDDLGYRAVGFTSVTEALSAFTATPDRFHALLSDEMMPGTPGSQLAHLIRSLRPSLPILIMTGYAGATVMARARAAGVEQVLKKPVSMRDLADAMARALMHEGRRAPRVVEQPSTI
jgi:PAS domain S-box-containing protein